MDVVLREDVEKLGLRGEVVSVARGYARNYLLPRGLAELATPGLVREIARRDEQRARHEAKTGDEARSIAARLEALELRFDVNAGPTGTLFGSVTATTIADRLWEQERIRVDRRRLLHEPIKRIGRHSVPVELFADVTATLRVAVAPEGRELPPEEELQAQAATAEEAELAAAEAAEAEHRQAEAAAEAIESEAAAGTAAAPEPAAAHEGAPAGGDAPEQDPE